MSFRQILAALLRALGGTPAPAPKPTPAPPPAPGPAPAPTPGDVAARLLAEHNRARAAAGLPALAPDVALMSAARSHAAWMASKGAMAHQRIGDGDLAMRLHAVSYAARSAGENIAQGQRDVAQVMAAWLSSPGHRANILGAFSGAGMAMARAADGSPFWCAVFGTPASRAGADAASMPGPYTVSSPRVTEGGAASSVAIESHY
jgi:uncharacterized protein YkwD